MVCMRQVSARVAILTANLSLCLLLERVVGREGVSAFSSSGAQQRPSYQVLVDAGSTGCRVYVYRSSSGGDDGSGVTTERRVTGERGPKQTARRLPGARDFVDSRWGFCHTE